MYELYDPSLESDDTVARLVEEEEFSPRDTSGLVFEVMLLTPTRPVTAGVSFERRSWEPNAPKSYQGRNALKRCRENEQGQGSREIAKRQCLRQEGGGLQSEEDWEAIEQESASCNDTMARDAQERHDY